MPFVSHLIWHAVLRNDDVKANHNFLHTFWAEMTQNFGLTIPRDGISPEFPKCDQLEISSSAQLLSFLRQDTLPDHELAFVYSQGDVVGLVLLLQSVVRNDFDNLVKKRKERWPTLSFPSALPLHSFVTWAEFTNTPLASLPAIHRAEPVENQATDESLSRDLTFWNLPPDDEGDARILIAVPTVNEAQKRFEKWTIGLPGHRAVPFLEFQASAAKVFWLNREFDASFPHGRWSTEAEAIEENSQQLSEAAEALETSGAALVDISATARRVSGRRGVLQTRCAQLQVWINTSRIAERNLRRLWPGTPDDHKSTASLYDIDALRDQIAFKMERELDYFDAFIARYEGLAAIASSLLEQQRVNIEKQRLAVEHQNSVQGNFISGILLGLAVVQASSEWKNPELRWPMCAFFAALGFALPLLILGRHDTPRPKSWPWAWAALGGTGVAWSYAYFKYEHPKGHLSVPLLDIGVAGIVAFIVAFGVAFFWPDKKATTTSSSTAQTSLPSGTSGGVST